MKLDLFLHCLVFWVALQLFTWGWNQRGTLGHPPETKTENIPSQVKALANVKIVQVICFYNIWFLLCVKIFLWYFYGILIFMLFCVDSRQLLVGGIVWLLMMKAELTPGVICFFIF